MAAYCQVYGMIHFTSPASWLSCTPGSAPGPTLWNEYGKTLPFYRQHLQSAVYGYSSFTDTLCIYSRKQFEKANCATRVIFHGLHSNASPVLMATGLVNRRCRFSTPTEATFLNWSPKNLVQVIMSVASAIVSELVQIHRWGASGQIGEI